MVNYDTGDLRPFEDIEPNEWARLERARATTDPRKLAAMLPAWLKRDLALRAAPKPYVFVPNQPPVYPRLPTGAEWNAAHNQNSAKRKR